MKAILIFEAVRKEEGNRDDQKEQRPYPKGTPDQEFLNIDLSEPDLFVDQQVTDKESAQYEEE